MTTHYAAVWNGTVVGSRSSTSKHVGGTGKWGPYTHAAVVTRPDGTTGVLTYHSTEALARESARVWRNRGRETGVVPVVVTSRRLTVGGGLYGPHDLTVKAGEPLPDPYTDADFRRGYDAVPDRRRR